MAAVAGSSLFVMTVVFALLTSQQDIITEAALVVAKMHIPAASGRQIHYSSKRLLSMARAMCCNATSQMAVRFLACGGPALLKTGICLMTMMQICRFSTDRICRPSLLVLVAAFGHEFVFGDQRQFIK